MRRARRFWVPLLIAACVCVLTGAQRSQKPLTNADVVEMVKAGLAEDTIVLTIERSASDFDTSPPALIALKQNGVSQKIMDAMIKAATPETAPLSPRQ